MSEDLKIQISASGGDAAAGEVRKISAATDEVAAAQAKGTAATAAAAPTLAATAEREARLTELRNRAAEALAKQAEAEQKLAQERAAALESSAGAAAGGGEAGGAGALEGLAGKLGVVAAVAAASLTVFNQITDSIEASTQETLKQANALQKQGEEWNNISKAAQSFGDVLALQEKTGASIGKLKEEMQALDLSTGSWVDKFKIFANSDGESVVGGLMSHIHTAHEEQIEDIKQLMELEKVRAARAQQHSMETAVWNHALADMAPVDKLAALNEKMAELEEHQSKLDIGTEAWLREEIAIEKMKQRVEQAATEVKRLADAKSRQAQTEEEELEKVMQLSNEVVEARVKGIEKQSAAEQKEMEEFITGTGEVVDAILKRAAAEEKAAAAAETKKQEEIFKINKQHAKDLAAEKVQAGKIERGDLSGDVDGADIIEDNLPGPKPKRERDASGHVVRRGHTSSGGDARSPQEQMPGAPSFDDAFPPVAKPAPPAPSGLLPYDPAKGHDNSSANDGKGAANTQKEAAGDNKEAAKTQTEAAKTQKEAAKDVKKSAEDHKTAGADFKTGAETFKTVGESIKTAMSDFKSQLADLKSQIDNLST